MFRLKKKNSTPTSTQNKLIGRRQILKMLVAAGGMIATTVLWRNDSKAKELLPQIQNLSALSQIPFDPAGNLTITATWQKLGTEDVYFFVEFPEGMVHFSHSSPKPQGQNELKSTALVIPASKVNQGLYKLFLFNSTSSSISIEITVTTGAGATSFQVVLGEKYPDDERYLADISFSEGMFKERFGPFPYPILDTHLSSEHLLL